jgi:hypothetical protein
MGGLGWLREGGLRCLGSVRLRLGLREAGRVYKATSQAQTSAVSSASDASHLGSIGRSRAPGVISLNESRLTSKRSQLDRLTPLSFPFPFLFLPDSSCSSSISPSLEPKTESSSLPRSEEEFSS